MKLGNTKEQLEVPEARASKSAFFSSKLAVESKSSRALVKLVLDETVLVAVGELIERPEGYTFDVKPEDASSPEHEKSKSVDRTKRGFFFIGGGSFDEVASTL